MIKAIILDLDGTVYNGNKLIDGADDAIEQMRQSGLKVLFCSNNSSTPVADISDKLNSMGITCTNDEVISSGTLAIKYAIDNNLENVYFSGSDSMRKEFKENGIDLCCPEKCNNLIIGMDTKFNYSKMTAGVHAALNADKIIICNRDELFPTEDGVKPGCGAIVASILSVTRKNYDILLGKPNTMMMSFITKKYGFCAEEMMVIGDGIESDIAMANSYGSPSMLIGRDLSTLKCAISIHWDKRNRP